MVSVKVNFPLENRQQVETIAVSLSPVPGREKDDRPFRARVTRRGWAQDHDKARDRIYWLTEGQAERLWDRINKITITVPGQRPIAYQRTIMVGGFKHGRPILICGGTQEHRLARNSAIEKARQAGNDLRMALATAITQHDLIDGSYSMS